jgi:drug/metabolite transporter (DMT)-like permease
MNCNQLQRQRAYIALLANALIWGAAFPIIKPAFSTVTPMQYLYLRFLVAGVLSLPIFCYYYFKYHLKLSYSLKVIAIEILGLPLPLYLLYSGLDRTSALEASLIGSTGPIFVVLGGILFLHERETRREWQGLALSLLGSLILVAEPLLMGTTETLRHSSGNLLILGYNILHALYAVLAKRVYKTKPPLYFGSLTYLLTAGVYALILNYNESLPNYALVLQPSVLLPVLYMAIPGGILAFALYLYAQSKIEVSKANLFTYLNGVVSITASFLILGEVPSVTTLAAIALIAWGVWRGGARTPR